MSYKVIVAEDNTQEREALCNIFLSDNDLEIVGRCSNGKESLQLCYELRPDIAFLDIDMPEMQGIEVAKKVREFDKSINIVFVTGLEEYRDKAFEVYAIDYILKPYDEARIRSTIGRIKMTMGRIKYEKNSFIEINSKRTKVIIKQSEILFIESVNRTCYFHTIDDSYVCNTSLHELIKRLDDNFMMSHKSYIINLRKIIRTEVCGRSSLCVYFHNSDKTAQVSAKFYDEFREKIINENF